MSTDPSAKLIANDPIQWSNEIRDHVALADLALAVKRLIDFVHEFCRDPELRDGVIALSATYNQLDKDINNDILEPGEIRRARNRIALRILETLRLVADRVDEPVREVPNDPELLDEAILLQLDLTGTLSAEEKAETLQKLEALLPRISKTVIAEGRETAPKASAERPIIMEAQKLQRKFPSTGFLLDVEHMTVRRGHITALFGENSTGKTTLFNILAGELLKSRGTLRFPEFRGGDKLNWFRLKQQIAYVPQELPPWKDSLLDTLHYEAARHGKTGAENDRAVAYVLHRLDLNDHRHKSWNQLSGDYKLRFSLAKALISGAELLLLDEPLAHLDVKSQQIVLTDLYYLTRSRTNPLTVVVSSQHIHEIEVVADWMYYLDNGSLQDLGPTNQFGGDRRQNVFELFCPVPTKTLVRALSDFQHRNYWTSGVQFFLTTEKDVRPEQVIAHLAGRDIPVLYLRDLSRSVKTKFYEAQLS